MKRSFWIGIICAACCLGNIPSSSAVQTASIGSTFSCTFLDSGDQGFFDSSSTHTWDQGQIDAAMRALTTWDSLINSTPGRTLTVGLTWYDGANSSTLASAYSPYFYYQSNGPQQVSTLVESVWRDGSTRTATGYDIYIQCNTSHLNSLYYEAALSAEHTGKYDFQSILTHEVGHAAGFLSLATQTGTFQVQSGNASAAYSTMLYTRYDSLLTNQEGQSIVNKAGNGNTAFTLGETLSLGDTGLTAYNPATWQQGSSMAHIDSASDPDALMQYSISPDTYHRTLTDGEMELMRSMGWKMVPEPGTSTLSLLGLAVLALRRRRY